MSRRIPIIALIGRTNVGKSMLFNQITGRRIAIVDDSHGVTRDRSYAVVNRFAHPFLLVDTGGLVSDSPDEFHRSVREQSELAIEEADLIIGVFDGIHGVHPLDAEVVQRLRRSGKPVIWAVNKCEKDQSKLVATELYGLGIEELSLISAAHNLGVRELVHTCFEKLGDLSRFGDEDVAKRSIRVAILGRPNVGKSTLVNQLCGSNRQVTSETSGTTRDSIDIEVEHKENNFTLIDTAGLRKKARVEDGTLERYSNLRSLRSLVRADVCVLLLDATKGAPSEQDTKIAGLINERGKGLIVVVNKWDLIEKDHRTVKDYERAIYEELKFARYAPIVFTSALSGKRCTWILDQAKKVYDAGQLRVQTAELNAVLEEAFRARPAPVYRGFPIKLYFATQVSVAPPTIVLFMNHPTKLGFSYRRYLKNAIRKAFSFPGYDIKLLLRKRQEKGAENQDHASNS